MSSILITFHWLHGYFKWRNFATLNFDAYRVRLVVSIKFILSTLMWFVPPPRFRFLIQAPRPHQWQCILTCNAESPEDFEYCLPTKGCYSVNRILSSLTLVWMDPTGVKSCSPTAWVFCSCKGLSSDKASTLLYRVWLSLEVCPSESESLLRLAMHM